MELKAFSLNCYDKVFVEPHLVCDKSDAGKVIEELKADYKEACDRLQTANLIKDEQMCKDVLSKLEEQESLIAKKDAEINELK